MFSASRFVAQLSKAIRCCAICTCAFVASASASELKTYEFESNQPRMFRAAGGLTGLNIFSQLTGSFDVQLEDDGTAKLTRFDVKLVDVDSEGLTSPSGWEGLSIAQSLYVIPVGLSGTYNSALTYFSPQRIAPSLDPQIYIGLTPESSSLARFVLSSSSPLAVDIPVYWTDSPGFLVRLVPEPTSAAIAFCGALAGMLRPRRNRLAT